jgi:hypothetical protein
MRERAVRASLQSARPRRDLLYPELHDLIETRFRPKVGRKDTTDARIQEQIDAHSAAFKARLDGFMLAGTSRKSGTSGAGRPPHEAG